MGKLCLVIYHEEQGTENIVFELTRQQKKVLDRIGEEGIIGDILVVYRDLHGAIYNASASGADYWEKTSTQAAPGRVSVVYNPNFMQYRAIKGYLEQAREEHFVPVVLADIGTIGVRKAEDKGSGYGTIEYEGVKSALLGIAEEESIELVEYRIKELIKN